MIRAFARLNLDRPHRSVLGIDGFLPQKPWTQPEVQTTSGHRHSQPRPSPSCQGCPGHQSAFQLSVMHREPKGKKLPSEGGVDTVKVGLARVPLQGARNPRHIWPPSVRTSQRTGCRWYSGRCSPWTSSLASHIMTGANRRTTTPSTMPLLSCFNVDTNSSCTHFFDIGTGSAVPEASK